MNERYSILFSLPENLYSKGSPVIISAGNLLKDNKTGKYLAQLKIKNISPKTINAATIIVHCIDAMGKSIDPDVEHDYLDISVVQGDEFGQKEAVYLPVTSTCAFTVVIKRVVYSDNTVWENGVDGSPLPTPERLDPDSANQFEIQFGCTAKVKGQVYQDLWLCPCGCWNRNAKCYHCGKEKSEQLAVDYDQLKLDAQTRLSSESTRLAKNKKKTIFSIVLASFLFLFVSGYIWFTKVYIPNSRYKNAIALYYSGEYDKAISAFSQMGGYKNSKNWIEMTTQEKKYSEATALLNEQKYYEAARAFYQIRDYKDSWNLCFDTWGKLVDRRTIESGGLDIYQVLINGSVHVTSYGTTEHGQSEVKNWSDIVAISCYDFHIVGLKEDGTVVAAGENKQGQCNVSGWKDIVGVVTGNDFTIGLKADGTVVATGSNKYGQCNVSEWKDIVGIAAGDKHTVGLKSDGTVIAIGNNEQGQCNVSEMKEIVSVAAGVWHTVALRSDGTVSATGYNYDGECDVGAWTDIIAISAIGNRTAALRSDKTILWVGNKTYTEVDTSSWKNKGLLD